MTAENEIQSWKKNVNSGTVLVYPTNRMIIISYDIEFMV